MTELSLPLYDQCMKHCGGCNRSLDDERFSMSSSKKDGRESRCKECKRDAYLAKRAHYLVLAKSRSASNRDVVLLRKKSSYALRKSEISSARKAARAARPGSEATTQRANRARVKAACFIAMGGSCPCGESDVDALCVDHVNDDGQEERSSGVSNLSVYRKVLAGEDPGRYQLLCFNCNLRKSILRDRSGLPTGIIKQCPTCFEALDSSSFKRDSKYPDGRYYECRACDRSRVVALKVRAMLAVGAISCPCGHSDVLTLSFDHMNDDGNLAREHGLGRTLYAAIVNGVADVQKYQVLCMNCNLKKHALRRSSARSSAGFSTSHTPPVREIVPAAPTLDVSFSVADVDVAVSDGLLAVVSFLESHHYAGYGRHGTVNVVGTVGGSIVAAAKFASPVRKEVATSIGLNYRDVMELDRMCIRPDCHLKNFASWFLSRAVKVMSVRFPSIGHVVSFADPEQGHSGTIYLAANWKDLGYGSRSYTYVAPDGSKIHKKTVYNGAKSRGLKESEFASSLGYVKSHTVAKRKFLFKVPKRRPIKEIHDPVA